MPEQAFSSDSREGLNRVLWNRHELNKQRSVPPISEFGNLSLPTRMIPHFGTLSGKTELTNSNRNLKRMNPPSLFLPPFASFSILTIYYPFAAQGQIEDLELPEETNCGRTFLSQRTTEAFPCFSDRNCFSRSANPVGSPFSLPSPGCGQPFFINFR